MSQNVERLKELLFEPETKALAKIAQRIELVADIDQRSRDALKRQLDDIIARVGNGERLSASVSEILSDALRRAEVANHHELSRSIAPLVISTIKAELRNSQDEMVEALYPITGRLVKAYVASALKDLADQMNRRLEQNAVILRLQSIATGRSVGELALAGTQNFEIKELYLIRRGSGALIARWPNSETSGREHAMSGVLAAINEFASEALLADQSSLRKIDLGEESVYLRASPLYLLAARCGGYAPDSIEQILDEAFLDAIDRQHVLDRDSESPQFEEDRVLAALGEDLNKRAADEIVVGHRPSTGRLLRALIAVVVLPLLGWLAFSWYSSFAENRVRTAASAVVASISAMQGYPIEFDVSPRGWHLIVSGLAPSVAAKGEVADKLAAKLRGTLVQDRISVVAGSGPRPKDLTGEVAKVQTDVAEIHDRLAFDAAHRACDRAVVSLEKGLQDLTRASASPSAGAFGNTFRSVKDDLAESLEALKATRARLSGTADAAMPEKAAADLTALSGRIELLADQLLSAVVPGLAEAQAAPVHEYDTSDVTAAAEDVAAAAYRLQSFAGAAMIAALRMPEPSAPPVSASDKLRAFAVANAVFFSNDTDYRDPEAARGTLEALATLIKRSGNLVRVVGYTDEAGGQTRNIPLAQLRAERVQRELIELGIDKSRLVAVGRADALDLTAAQGPTSTNRRVEFEVGFEGENAQ